MRAVPRQVENRIAARMLVVRWEDGRVDELTHEVLRGACPCAECRAIRRAGDAVAAPAGITLTAIAAVGHYALNLAFDDGHGRGIYPFALLADIAAAVTG
ncbi:DUF971 domain-containing protein [Pseudoduganella armeniaca]|uniref:Gamma-butyrobetaine hydroxylase-like N-terminal domain-containing protein n=1 Tax=Pseudoduganella armeniaca TaxID=2072590 RepID=A0A2R4CGH9_9BURK|nr:DUF971 domain-containing protein [Pseudoduganella armeniaca]AVR98642.1 hypothetical protein C9I28_25660 [Pseudoduganella armeniaca]